MMDYTPDRGIVKQLRELDPDLDVRWDRDRCRWVVTCLGQDVQTVHGVNGTYQPLDGRIVAMFREKTWVYRNHYGTLHMQDSDLYKRNFELLQKQRAAQRDDFRQYMVEDGYRRVVGVGSGGGSSMFQGWSPS